MNKARKILLELDSNYVIYFLLFIALIFRLFNLNYEGLWNDEIINALNSSPGHSFGDIIAILKWDYHPPLHFLLSHYWSILFSYNDTSLRLLNVLIGVWAVFSVYKLAKVSFNEKVAFYAICLAVLNCYMIQYSQEVRSYGLLILLSNYSFIYFFKLMKEEFDLKNSIWYVITTTALVYTHFYGFLIVSAQFVAFLFVMNWKWFFKYLYKYIITFALPSLLFLFWAFTLPEEDDRKIDSWRDAADINLILKYPQDFFNDYLLSSIAVFLFFTTLLYLLVTLFMKKRKIDNFYKGSQMSLIILITWIAIYFLIPYIKSNFSVSLMVNRYFVPLITPLLVIMAFYFNKIQNNGIKNKIFAVVIGYSILLLFLNIRPYYTKTTAFREVALEVKQINNEAPVLCLARNGRLYEYYLWQNGIKNTKISVEDFTKMIKETKPEEFFVILDQRPIPEQFKYNLPKFEGYMNISTRLFKNKSGIHCAKFFVFSNNKVQ